MAMTDEQAPGFSMGAAEMKESGSESSDRALMDHGLTKRFAVALNQ